MNMSFLNVVSTVTGVGVNHIKTWFLIEDHI